MKYLLICLYRALWIFPLRSLKLIRVKNYSDLYRIALWEIRQLKRLGNVSMISAPLFSGGSGSFKSNLRILQNYINFYSRRGSVLWNQIPYLDLKVQKWARNIDIQTSEKINKFYVPLIKSKELTSLVCVHSNNQDNIVYTDSLGCKTEREAAQEAGIETCTTFLPKLHKLN